MKFGNSKVSKTIRDWAEMIQFSHTIFALPFAISSMVVASKDHHGWPGGRVFGLVILAMICARTCAMCFNRIADRHFDKLNPRTKDRHLPSGKVSVKSAWMLFGISAISFLITSYFINAICFFLSPIALGILCFYSLTKRLTNYTHLFLGLAIGLAPIGAWMAVKARIDFPPILLGLAVMFWLIGFDIIYATQDYDFDKRHGLGSIVVAWGMKNALQSAFISHLIMWLLLAFFGLMLGFRLAYFTGLGVMGICLLMEHWLARKRDLKWIHFAFFRLNALISVVFLLAILIEVIFPMFRIQI